MRARGGPGQYWLDIRQPAVAAVIKARIALAQQKRCDAAEADEVDARSNNPGFPIAAAEQQGFIRALAAEADLAAKGASICPQANALNFDTLIKHLDLGAPRYACR